MNRNSFYRPDSEEFDGIEELRQAEIDNITDLDDQSTWDDDFQDVRDDYRTGLPEDYDPSDEGDLYGWDDGHYDDDPNPYG